LVGALIVGAAQIDQVGAADLWLTAVAVIAAWAPVRYRRGGDAHVVTVEDAVVGAFILSGRAELAPLAIIFAQAVARGGARPGWLKFSFSLAPVGLGSLAAVVVSSSIGIGGSPLDARSLVSVTAAILAYQGVSFLVTADVFRRLDGTRLRGSFDATWQITALTIPGNTVLALLLAVAVEFDLRAIAPVALLGVGVHLGYRGYLKATAERRRAERLAELSRSLVPVSTGETPVQEWLTSLCELFGAHASGVWLASSEGPAETFAGGSLGGELEPGDLRPSAVPEWRAWAGGGELLSAPVEPGSEQGGGLVVARRHGLESWGASDLALLSVVAHEAVVARRNAQLFHQVEWERARWKEESSRLTDILGAASDGIAMVASDGTIVSWNPGMTALSGVDADQATGKPWWTVLRLRDVDGEDLLPEGDHVVSAALSGERHADPVALQALRRDGQWRWLRATFSPLVGEDGSVAGTVVVARDVTAETEAEGLKADFVATVSHELRTPLTPLKGFVATLRQRGDELTADQTELMYGSMEAQVMRLERLVGDLLVVADLERGQLVVGHELVDLRRAVEIAIDDEAEGYPERVTLTGDMDLTAAADGSAVVRIIRALISNALKHTDGAVEVELGRDGGSPVVRVRDEGPGIPPWEQDRIFRRFHRLGDHLLRTQGPGLGLSIARALADRLGGSIDIASDLGHGATFTLRLRPATPMPVPARPTLSDAG
jgi:PAS domain S-box-containing protein